MQSKKKSREALGVKQATIGEHLNEASKQKE